MIITCPACKTRYMIKSDKLGLDPKVVRCAKCKKSWEVKPVPVNSVEEDKPPLPPIARLDAPNLKEQQQELNNKIKKRKNIVFSILCGFLIASIVMLVVLKDKIVDAKPEFATIYQLVGLDVKKDEDLSSGLVITDVERVQEKAGDSTILIFSGKIKNQSEVEVPVPTVKVQLFNEDGILLDDWSAQGEKKTLKPNESTIWTCRFYDPPLNQISQFKTFFAK